MCVKCLFCAFIGGHFVVICFLGAEFSGILQYFSHLLSFLSEVENDVSAGQMGCDKILPYFPEQTKMVYFGPNCRNL